MTRIPERYEECRYRILARENGLDHCLNDFGYARYCPDDALKSNDGFKCCFIIYYRDIEVIE